MVPVLARSDSNAGRVQILKKFRSSCRISCHFEKYLPPRSQAVPEPSALTMLGLGALGLLARRRQAA
jgi:hypothetical protein